MIAAMCVIFSAKSVRSFCMRLKRVKRVQLIHLNAALLHFLNSLFHYRILAEIPSRHVRARIVRSVAIETKICQEYFMLSSVVVFICQEEGFWRLNSTP